MWNDDVAALTQAVIANPEDDLPRVMLADALDERNQEGDTEYAVYIRLSVNLAANPFDRGAVEAEARRTLTKGLSRLERGSPTLRDELATKVGRAVHAAMNDRFKLEQRQRSLYIDQARNWVCAWLRDVPQLLRFGSYAYNAYDQTFKIDTLSGTVIFKFSRGFVAGVVGGRRAIADVLPLIVGRAPLTEVVATDLKFGDYLDEYQAMAGQDLSQAWLRWARTATPFREPVHG